MGLVPLDKIEGDLELSRVAHGKGQVEEGRVITALPQLHHYILQLLILDAGTLDLCFHVRQLAVGWRRPQQLPEPLPQPTLQGSLVEVPLQGRHWTSDDELLLWRKVTDHVRL